MTLYKRDYHLDWARAIDWLLVATPATDQPPHVQLAIAILSTLRTAAPLETPVDRVIRLTGCDLEDLEALSLATALSTDPTAKIILTEGWIVIVPA
jgi:hypothetical protein